MAVAQYTFQELVESVEQQTEAMESNRACTSDKGAKALRGHEQRLSELGVGKYGLVGLGRKVVERSVGSWTGYEGWSSRR